MLVLEGALPLWVPLPLLGAEALLGWLELLGEPELAACPEPLPVPAVLGDADPAEPLFTLVSVLAAVPPCGFAACVPLAPLPVTFWFALLFWLVFALVLAFVLVFVGLNVFVMLEGCV